MEIPEFPSEVHARYLLYAESDLDVASRALAPPLRPHTACFLARESAEKSLKAFLYAARNDAPPLHGLTTLLRECLAVDKGFGRYRQHCERLAPYVDSGRYPPDDDYDFTEDEAKEAVRLARELLETVRSAIERRRARGLL